MKVSSRGLCVMILFFGVFAFAKVKIENVRVMVTEQGKKPVKIVMPYWVAKEGAEVTDKLKLGEDEIPMKEIIKVIEKAPRLGPVMTIEEGPKKIEISIE